MTNYTIESSASVMARVPEKVRAESLFPDGLRDNAAGLIDLLKDYYDYLSQKGQPGQVMSDLLLNRDLDTADSNYLDLIQKEVAASVPKLIVADRVKLYKSMLKYYSVRGSEESISLFFRILFNDQVEIYYPQSSMLIPSSGNWDRTGRRPVYDAFGNLTGYEPGIYTDNKGFLSDTIKLQDSYFYQKFSYVIQTGNNVDKWKNAFNRLVHPAGFIFFGEILILVENTNTFTVVGDAGQDAERILSSAPKLQPGLITDLNLPRKIWVEIISRTGWFSLVETMGNTGYIPGETVRGSISGATATLNSYYAGTYAGIGLTGNAFLTNISGTFVSSDQLVGDVSRTGKPIRSWILNSGVCAALLAREKITVKLDVPAGTNHSVMLKFLDSALIGFYRDAVISTASVDYQYGDYTVNDAINNTIEINGCQIGVTLL